MSSPNIFKVGIICGSTRAPRIAPQITQFVHDTIQQHLSNNKNHPTTDDGALSAPPSSDHPIASLSSSPQPEVQLDIVDIADFHLPLFDEPGIPQAITDPARYAHQHTRAWSARIAALDAFVFVTPQYNWGIPAALKNAVDFLYHEWTGKPAMVVSYGGHGGGHAAAALRLVCTGLRMRVGDEVVSLTFPDREFRDRCFRGEELGLGGGGGRSGTWLKEMEEIVAVWKEMAARFELKG